MTKTIKKVYSVKYSVKPDGYNPTESDAYINWTKYIIEQNAKLRSPQK